MKICIVSPNYPLYFRRDETMRFGGAEVQAGFLAGALASQGHEVIIVTANLRPDEPLPFAAENAFDSDAGVAGLRFFHPRTTGVCRALRKIDADVYYQRNASVLTGITALFCRMKGRVFVYGAGSDTDFSFREARLDNTRDRLLFYTGLKLANGVVVQNQFQREKYAKRHGAPVRVIPNGVDLTPCDAEKPRELVAWIGGIRRVKQPEIYLELARRMPERRFVLLGGGSGVQPGFEKEILEAAAAIPNLTLTGYVSHDAIREYLSRAMVLVNTSRVEGFPNAYLEAWNACVPVATFNDIDGIIESEKLGAVCKGIDDVQEAVEKFCGDPHLRAAAGKRGRAVAEARFSAPVLGRQYVAFFEDLVYRNARSRRRAEKAEA